MYLFILVDGKTFLNVTRQTLNVEVNINGFLNLNRPVIYNKSKRI